MTENEQPVPDGAVEPEDVATDDTAPVPVVPPESAGPVAVAEPKPTTPARETDPTGLPAAADVAEPAAGSGRRLRVALIASAAGVAAIVVAVVAVLAVSGTVERPEPVFAPGALDGLHALEPPASLGEMSDTATPTGFSGTASDVLAHDVATFAGTDPTACALFAYLEPVGVGDRTATDRVITVADLVGDDGSTVTVSARAFANPESAAEHLDTVADTLAECADGYSSPFWDATALEPGEYPDPADGITAVTWLESGFNQDADVYQYRAAELRRGNIVVRATCTLVGSADGAPCTELWDAVAAQLAALPAPVE